MQKKLYIASKRPLIYQMKLILQSLLFLKSKFLLLSFSDKSNVSVEYWSSEYDRRLSTWQHGWHDWETLLCPLLNRWTVLNTQAQLKTDGCWNYSDAKGINSVWDPRIENNFLRGNQTHFSRIMLKTHHPYTRSLPINHLCIFHGIELVH